MCTCPIDFHCNFIAVNTNYLSNLFLMQANDENYFWISVTWTEEYDAVAFVVVVVIDGSFLLWWHLGPELYPVKVKITQQVIHKTISFSSLLPFVSLTPPALSFHIIRSKDKFSGCPVTGTVRGLVFKSFRGFQNV